MVTVMIKGAIKSENYMIILTPMLFILGGWLDECAFTVEYEAFLEKEDVTVV